MQSSESLDTRQSLKRLDRDRAWVRSILDRITPRAQVARPLVVLDIGAAQGRAVACIRELGHECTGVEPWEPAIAASRDLGQELGVQLDIRHGTAEDLPFPDASFDAVLAMSVLEHVDDLERSLSEIRRVLRPGGLFWFDSASAMCPRQSEIAHVPLFGWYPLRLKRWIMRWAQRHRPAWIGYTDKPAMHWFTPRSARRQLREAGFGEVLDRWQLRSPSEDTGPRGMVVGLANRIPPLRLLGDVLVTGCSYLAIVPGQLPAVLATNEEVREHPRLDAAA